MKHITILIFSILIMLCTPVKVFTQLVVNTGSSADQYAQQLLGPGVTVSNASFSGTQGSGGGHVQNTGGYDFNVTVHQIGDFTNGNSTNLGLSDGLVLATGKVTDAELPNNTSTGQFPSGYPANANSVDNDPDLNNLTNEWSYNCAILEFDFVPQGNQISFDYVFASSEYPGWVNSGYNDVFGFFLSGPGINGSFSNNSVNIATIPGTNTPVSINNVNGGTGSNGGCPSGAGTNAQYYVDDCNDNTFPYHGFTTVLTAEYDVECGETYHIKLAIGDIDDVNWDSAIFLKKNSLISSELQVTPETANLCEGESVTLEATLPDGPPTGTFEWSTGETTSTITVTPSTSTDYSVIYTENGCEMEAIAEVNVSSPVLINNTNVGACDQDLFDFSGEIEVSTTPSTGDLVVVDCNNDTVVLASAPFDNTTYPFTLSDLNADGQSCTLTAFFTDGGCDETTHDFTAPAPCSGGCAGVNITYEADVTDADCDSDNGAIDLSADGGESPYSYSIDNGTTTQGTGSFTDLAPGEYTIHIEDDNGCVVTGTETIVGFNTEDPSFDLTDFCEGESNGASNIVTPGGVFSFNPAIGDGASIDDGTGEITNGVGGTTYYIDYATPGVCPDTSNEEVTVMEVPTFTVTSSNPSCGNDDGSVTISGLTPSTDYSISYSDGNTVGPNTMTSDANGDVVIDELGQGAYTDFSISNNSCAVVHNGTINLNEDGAPAIDVPNDTTICEGESISFTATNPDGGTISWDNGVEDGVTFVPSGTGTITYTASAMLNGCTSTAQVSVVVNANPDVNAGADIEVCEGEDVVLTGSGATNYVWSNGVTDGVPFVPTSDAIYTVVGTDANGCKDSSQVEVTVTSELDVDFEGDELVGCQPHTVNFTNNSGSNDNCTWDFGDGTTETGCVNISHTYSTPGFYDVTLTVESNSGCANTVTKTNYIEITDAPTASFTADPMVVGTSDTEVEFTNQSEGGAQYIWSFGDGSPEETTFDASHIFPDGQAGSYVVTLIADSGEDCADTASLIIEVEEELIYYVPNTFTPDGDDFNEVFLPIFTSGFDPQAFEMLIFNRWGELIFESHDSSVGWDGTYGNEIVKDGSYIWKIVFSENKSDEKHTVHGHVTIIR